MDDQYLVTHQTRAAEPTSYELELAGMIESIFATGVHDLPGLVEGLQSRGLAAPDGAAWTEESFRVEIAKLGA